MNVSGKSSDGSRGDDVSHDDAAEAPQHRVDEPVGGSVNHHLGRIGCIGWCREELFQFLVFAVHFILLWVVLVVLRVFFRVGVRVEHNPAVQLLDVPFEPLRSSFAGQFGFWNRNGHGCTPFLSKLLSTSSSYKEVVHEDEETIR